MVSKAAWICVVLFLFSAFRSEAQLKLEVKITNIEVFNGKPMLLGIFRETDGFPTGGNAWKNQIRKATGAELSFFFDLPPGKYAFAVYHDTNSNNKIDKNWVGYPSEPFGFSRNFVPRLGAPSFTDCAISLSSDGQVIEIKLIQP